ncbi:MAG TPA: DUF2934 domain-containing protein [Gammaproteobacteria bacterium]|nr:DUF2934 domain-containing protein [Gammaproteobacteria bacterium]
MPKKTKTAKPKKSTSATKRKAAGKGKRSASLESLVTKQPLGITPEERWRMIAVAAYHKAEKRGFAAGGEMDDWFEAEREVDELLGKP